MRDVIFPKEARKLYDAAYVGDLEMFMKMLEAGWTPHPAWEVNPLRGVIEKSHMPFIAEELLRRGDNVYLLDNFLIRPRCPTTGNTLLHLAAAQHVEFVAIFLIRSLADYKKDHAFQRQRFLEALNNEGKTALHIAAEMLHASLVDEFLLEERLRINVMGKNCKETVLDVITRKCEEEEHRNIRNWKWKKPWRISIKLRLAGAKHANQLRSANEVYEEAIKIQSSGTYLSIMSDSSWNSTLNTILVVATLALSLIFAALLSLPQSLVSPPSTDSMPADITKISVVTDYFHESLGQSKLVKVFIVSLTLACMFLVSVLGTVLHITDTDTIDTRVFVIFYSWFCFSAMGLFLIVAYFTAIYIYMGLAFTRTLFAYCAGIQLFLVSLLLLSSYPKQFLKSLSRMLRLTLVHGFIFTLLSTFLPYKFADFIVYRLLFSETKSQSPQDIPLFLLDSST